MKKDKLWLKLSEGLQKFLRIFLFFLPPVTTCCFNFSYKSDLCDSSIEPHQILVFIVTLKNGLKLYLLILQHDNETISMKLISLSKNFYSQLLCNPYFFNFSDKTNQISSQPWTKLIRIPLSLSTNLFISNRDSPLPQT